MKQNFGTTSTTAVDGDRWWAALVTFERRQEGENAILPEWAWGACGWMAVLAPSDETIGAKLGDTLAHHALRLVEIADSYEIHSADSLARLDEHLAANFRDIEAHAVTVWGTLHCYKGEGQA